MLSENITVANGLAFGSEINNSTGSLVGGVKASESLNFISSITGRTYDGSEGIDVDPQTQAPSLNSGQLDELRTGQAKLAAKKVKGTLSPREKKELLMIRWLIDTAEEAETRANFAQLDLLIGAQERIAAEIASFMDAATGLMRGKSKR